MTTLGHESDMFKGFKNPTFEGKFSMGLLHEAYFSVTYGYTEPRLLRCGSRAFEHFVDYLQPSGRIIDSARFNLAQIMHDKDLPDNEMEFEAKYQHGPVLKARIRLTE